MNENRNVEKEPGRVKTFLREWGSYASLLATVVGPTLAWFGLQVNRTFLRWLLYGGLLLPLLGIAWLRREYLAAKRRIEEEGTVQRPEWLWRLFTGGITHKVKELSAEAPIMVIVPPGMEKKADDLKKIYNPNDNGPLVFHFIKRLSDGTIAEEQGTRSDGAEIRSLKILSHEMAACAGVLLLDDSLWREEKYPKTLEVVQQWCIDHSVRPIMAIRVQGGSLIYSWVKFNKLIGGQGLYPRLLAQAINRGTEWWDQAQTNRRLVFRLAIIAFVLFLGCATLGYFFWQTHRAWQRRDDTLTNLTTINSQERLKATQSMANFRNKTLPFSELLKANSREMKSIIERGSAATANAHVIVMMFSVINNGSFVNINEVAATRDKTDLRPFDYDTAKPETVGIAACAVRKRLFVLWTGDSLVKPQKTTRIEAWNLQGQPVEADLRDGKLHFKDGTSCQYYEDDVSWDDARHQMLCVPAGVADNSGEVVGAICVSSLGPNFLNEDWMRYLLARFGTSLSFSSWEAPDSK